jgi:Zn-dependent protease with chaperone function
MRRLAWSLVCALGCGAMPAAAASQTVKVNGYLDFRKPGYLIVDAQRIQVGAKTKFNGGGKAKSLAQIPIGYEIKATGTREKDGTVVAKSIEAKPNGMAMFEAEVLQGTAEAEQSFLKARKVYDTKPDGSEVIVGALHDSGPQVDRCRHIIDRLLPTYVDPKQVRVYVVDNKDWNAMAMANYSIYVYSGLMADMDDDEMAIVLGHELAHATHEHSRRQAKASTFSGIAGQAAVLGAGMIHNDLGKAAAQEAASLGVTTFGNVYSREYEDQADRVGLRYVYEAGYDYKKAPALWRRFADKYGDSDKVTNFFFGNHSLSAKRADELTREIENNYKDPAKDPPSHSKG